MLSNAGFYHETIQLMALPGTHTLSYAQSRRTGQRYVAAGNLKSLAENCMVPTHKWVTQCLLYMGSVILRGGDIGWDYNNMGHAHILAPIRMMIFIAPLLTYAAAVKNGMISKDVLYGNDYDMKTKLMYDDQDED